MLGDLQFIPWGGGYVTQSIAERLSMTIDMAEDIKKSHALAEKADSLQDSGEILVKRESGYMPIRRDAVCEVVNWEIENLLTHLEAVVKGSHLYHELNKGLVLVGGGSLLPGLAERIEERINLPVVMGAATNGLNNVAIYASAIGLAQMQYLKKRAEVLDIRKAKDFKDKVVNALKDVAQEYF
jgi:cell division ATPase FtsA